MKETKLKLVGTSPLLLSCDRLADPLDPATIRHRQLTSKRNKTEDDHLAIARSQWEGLLYLDKGNNVVMPTMNIRACLVAGGKINKLGQQLKRAALMLDEYAPLDYGKKLSVDQLWAEGYVDRRSVVVSRARVIAYRPKFSQWQLAFTLFYDESILDESQIVQSFENSGKYVGLGGFRPEKGGIFGRFTVEKV